MKLGQLVLFWLLSTVNGARNAYFENRGILNNNVCKYITFRYENIMSVIHCMVICTQDSACTTVQYLPDSKVCHGCRAGSSSNLPEDGALGFEKIDSGCIYENTDNIHAQAAFRALKEKGKELCITDVLEVNNGVAFGNWCEPEFCELGKFAFGYSMRIDEMSTFGVDDDTGANAIRLLCKSRDGMVQNVMPGSCVGPKGDWKGPITCRNDSNYYVLKSFQLRVEQPLLDGPAPFETFDTFVDETTVKYAQFNCGSLAAAEGDETVGVQWGTLPWSVFEDSGTPSEWSRSCGTGRAICGLRTRMHKVIVDDETGLNDVVFYCC